MPLASSVGWLGWMRTERRPGRPRVFLNRVTTRHLRATEIRSWLRMSLDTAAAISGVRPRAREVTDSGAASSSHSRNSPTVSEDTGAKAARSWESRMRRVTSSAS